MSERVAHLTQTCVACPSQWEGRLEDGRHVYVRYRWGYLTVGIADEFLDAVDAETFGIEHGNELDGWLTEGEMWQLTRGVLERTYGVDV